jgi:hypothetical protein
VEQRHGAVTRQRRAEMLHFIGTGDPFDAEQNRNLPVVTGEPTDNPTKCTPVVEFARRPGHVDDKCCSASLIEVVPVARRPAGEPGAQRGRAGSIAP